MKQDEAIELVRRELNVATAVHGPMLTWHDGGDIIKEEYDELWDEIRKVRNRRDMSNVVALRKESKQLAAMAIRFMVDLC